MDDEKEYQYTIKKLNDEIANLKLKHLDIANYEQWNSEQIVAWIINLDENRFTKYKDTLLYHLNEEEIIGNDLEEINEIDLQRWQIKSFKDKKFLLQRIKHLTQQNQNPNQNDDDNDVAVVNEEEGAESGGYHR